MKLPFGKKVLIPKIKLTQYLLSETHTLGKFKAKFFNTYGFNKTNVNKLEIVLRKIAQTKEVDEKTSSPHGTKYIIDSMIQTPKGKKVMLRTIWILEPNQKYSRFVTAYPV